MKLATLLPALLAPVSVLANAIQLQPRQNGEPKDMDQMVEWAVIHGWCPIYIGKVQPEWDRSLEICIKYCKENDDGEYASCESQFLVDAVDKFPSEIEPDTPGIGGTMTDVDGYPYVPSKCSCSNPTVEALSKEIFSIVAEGLAQLDNILCTVLLKAVMTIVEEGLSFIPVAGPVFKGFTTAVKAAKSFAENAGGATDLFQGWIEPACGMPNAEKFDPLAVFKDLTESPDEFGKSIGCKNKDPKKCKKLPPTNDRNRPTKKAEDDQPSKTADPGASNTEDKPEKTKACKLKRSPPELYHVFRDPSEHKRGIRSVECNNNVHTTHEIEVTSLKWDPAQATALPFTATCGDEAGQACHHYQSAIAVNPEWATLTCPGTGSTKRNDRGKRTPAVNQWYADTAVSWRNQLWRDHKDSVSDKGNPSVGCQADEFPPYYLISETDKAWTEGGVTTKGQLIRYIPHNENSNGGGLWKGACFFPVFKKYSAQELWDQAFKDSKKQTPKRTADGSFKTSQQITMNSKYRPTFEIDFKQSGQDGTYGLKSDLNKCLPTHALSLDGTTPFDDPGFALLRFDKYNVDAKRNTWDYRDTTPQAPAPAVPSQGPAAPQPPAVVPRSFAA